MDDHNVDIIILYLYYGYHTSRLLSDYIGYFKAFVCFFVIKTLL